MFSLEHVCSVDLVRDLDNAETIGQQPLGIVVCRIAGAVWGIPGLMASVFVYGFWLNIGGSLPNLVSRPFELEHAP